MKVTGLMGSILVLLVVILLACSPKPAPAVKATPIPPVAAPAPVVAVPVSPAIREWERVIELAKKEGKVVIYGPPGAEIRRAMVSGFNERFGITVEWIAGAGSELGPKMLSERRAGLYFPDLHIGGATTSVTILKPEGVLDPIEPALLLPEVLEPSVWFGGKLPLTDKGRTMFKFIGYPEYGVSINTELVNPEELRSLRDLLHPNWKGKMVLNDPTRAGMAAKWFGVVGTVFLDYDFMRQLAKQDLVITRDRRLQAEWVARGKYAIALGGDSTAVTELRRAGAPIRIHKMQEGGWLAGGYGFVTLINRAPHPNAAKVFINWLLSKEGQTLFAKAYNSDSLRLDVSTEGIDPEKIRDPKGKYFMGSDDEDFLLAQPEQMKIAMEIFGHLMR